MRIITVSELAGLSGHQLARLYFQVGKQLVGTRMYSPERRAVEETLANIRFVMARRHRTPR